METFTEAKEFVDSQIYSHMRQIALDQLDLKTIDEPIRGLIDQFRLVPHCFTLQSCYGHFVCGPEQNDHNLNRLPPEESGIISYRLAYLALCLENSGRGRMLHRLLAKVPDIAPTMIQFGSADWFWQQNPNSYVLQVIPDRYKTSDRTFVSYAEALHIQQSRDLFFIRINELLGGELHAADI
ncbi:MAG: hypothetical protein P8184_02095 [Calditrichia bacterium]